MFGNSRNATDKGRHVGFLQSLTEIIKTPSKRFTG